MLTRAEQAEVVYHTLFDWQTPLSLWNRSLTLKKLLGDALITGRNVGNIEIKKLLEGWVMGKSLHMAYSQKNGAQEDCLVRVVHNPAMDGQIYYNGKLQCVEVTQALYPGRKRNVFGTRNAGFPPPAPLRQHEEEAYETYRDAFINNAFAQVEARIEHKFQLYKSLDYLIIYMDLFDTSHPRFGYFAHSEFVSDYADDLYARLSSRFSARWCDKIGHLFLLGDQPASAISHFSPAQLHAPLSLA